MKLSEKALSVSRINDDLNFLRGEFARNTLFGSCPDGDVTFEGFIDWLSDEGVIDNVEHLIKVVRDMEKLK